MYCTSIQHRQFRNARSPFRSACVGSAYPWRLASGGPVVRAMRIDRGVMPWRPAEVVLSTRSVFCDSARSVIYCRTNHHALHSASFRTKQHRSQPANLASPEHRCLQRGRHAHGRDARRHDVRLLKRNLSQGWTAPLYERLLHCLIDANYECFCSRGWSHVKAQAQQQASVLACNFNKQTGENYRTYGRISHPKTFFSRSI